MAKMTKVGNIEIIELDKPFDDWTGATHVLRNAESPGGFAIIIGGGSVDGLEGYALAAEIASALQITNQEIQHRAIEIEMEEDKKIAESRRKFEELLAQPTSDPEKFTRCTICGNEIPRPSHLPIGELSICDDCIPF